MRRVLGKSESHVEYMAKWAAYLRKRLTEDAEGLFTANPRLTLAMRQQGMDVEAVVLYGQCQLGKTWETLLSAWLLHFVYNVTPILFVKGNCGIEAREQFKGRIVSFNSGIDELLGELDAPGRPNKDPVIFSSSFHLVLTPHDSPTEAFSYPDFEAGKAQLLVRLCSKAGLSNVSAGYTNGTISDIQQIVNAHKKYYGDSSCDFHKDKLPVGLLFDEGDLLIASHDRGAATRGTQAQHRAYVEKMSELLAVKPRKADAASDEDEDDAVDVNEEEMRKESRSLMEFVRHVIFITATPVSILITGEEACYATAKMPVRTTLDVARAKYPYFGLSPDIVRSEFLIAHRPTAAGAPKPPPARASKAAKAAAEAAEAARVAAFSSTTAAIVAQTARFGGCIKRDPGILEMVGDMLADDRGVLRVGLVHGQTQLPMHEELAKDLIDFAGDRALIALTHNGGYSSAEGCALYFSRGMADPDDLRLFEVPTKEAGATRVFKWKIVVNRLFTKRQRMLANESTAPSLETLARPEANIARRFIHFPRKVCISDILSMVCFILRH